MAKLTEVDDVRSRTVQILNKHQIETDGLALRDASRPPITAHYLMVTNIPLYRHGGVTSAGHLWFKDLARHVPYLERFSIACPIRDAAPAEAALPLSNDDRFDAVEFIRLPANGGLVSAVLSLPRIVVSLWGAIGQADIVHTGIAGWPIPYGWIVTPIAAVLRKKLVIIVESAPWRLNAGRSKTFRSRVSSLFSETLARWCVGRSDLAIFTQENYRESLLRNGRRSAGHVIHASWIDQDAIVSDDEGRQIWRRKLNPAAPELAVVFVGRLDTQKGLSVLLDAMRLLAAKHLPVRLDILGSGDLGQMCVRASTELSGSARVRVLGSVSYGTALFQLLRRYHALVLPSLSDEQPRIVYDAYSQALPVLATRTTGLQDCVLENRTGWLVTPNNAHELSRAIERAAANLSEMEAMGMEALKFARLMTHETMHRVRHELLLDLVRSTPSLQAKSGRDTERKQ